MTRKNSSRRGGRKAAVRSEKLFSWKMVVAIFLTAVVAFLVLGRSDAGVSGPTMSAMSERSNRSGVRSGNAARPRSQLVGYAADEVPEFSQVISPDGRLTKVFHHYWLTGAEPPEEQVRLSREWGNHVWSLIKRTDGLTPLATEVNQKVSGLNVGLVGPGNLAVLVVKNRSWSSACQEFPATAQLSILTPNRLGIDWSRPHGSFPVPNLHPSTNVVRVPTYRFTDALLSAVLVHEIGHFIRHQERGCRLWSDNEVGHSLEEVETHTAGGDILNHYSGGELDRMIEYVLSRVPPDAGPEETIAACSSYDWGRFDMLLASRDFGIDRGLLTTQFYLSAYFAVVDRRNGGIEEKAAGWRLVVRGAGW